MNAGRSLRVREKEAIRRMNLCWCNSKLSPGKECVISIGIANDNRIYNPEIVRYSGDCQFDVECLEAVSAISPLPPADSHSAFLGGCSVRFKCKPSDSPKPENGVIPAFDGYEIREQLQKHPSPANDKNYDQFVLVHRIPLYLLFRFPGMFSREELQSTSNLIEVKTGIANLEFDDNKKNWGSPVRFTRMVPEFYARWSELLDKPGITKNDVIEFAKGMDNFFF